MHFIAHDGLVGVALNSDWSFSSEMASPILRHLKALSHALKTPTLCLMRLIMSLSRK